VELSRASDARAALRVTLQTPLSHAHTHTHTHTHTHKKPSPSSSSTYLCFCRAFRKFFPNGAIASRARDPVDHSARATVRAWRNAGNSVDGFPEGAVVSGGGAGGSSGPTLSDRRMGGVSNHTVAHWCASAPPPPPPPPPPYRGLSTEERK